MSEPDRNEISARLRRLPADFLLALINATSILVIVAAILALVAMVRIDNLAGSVVTTMTEAVLSKIDLPSKGVLANLRNLTEEVRTLGNALREIKAGEHPALQSEITQLKETLTVKPDGFRIKVRPRDDRDRGAFAGSAGAVAAKRRGEDLGKLSVPDLLKKMHKEVNEKSA